MTTGARNAVVLSARGFAPGLLRAGFAMAALAAIGWWVAALYAAAHNAPRFSALGELQVALPASGETVIGQAELMQPAGGRSAESRHVRLRASANGQLLISRVAELRGLNLEFGDATEEGSSERYEISRGKGVETRLTLGPQTVTISDLDNGGVGVSVGQSAGRTAVYTVSAQGRLTMPGDRAAPRCVPELSEWLSDILSSFRSLVVKTRTRALAILGGKESCGRLGEALIALPNADPAVEFSLRRNRSDGRLFLAPFRGAGIAPVKYETRSGGRLVREHGGDSGLEWTVAAVGKLDDPPVTHFTAGRTRYRIAAEARGRGGWSVSIWPSSRVPLFRADLCADPAAGPSDAEAEDCPPHSARTPSPTPTEGALKASIVKKPTALERMFVASGQGLAFTERLARSGAIALALALLLSAPPPFLLRGGLRNVLPYAGASVLVVLAIAPDLVSLTGGSGDGQLDAHFMLWAMVGSWVFATFVVAFDPVGGWRLGAFWFLLCVLVAIGSISLFTMSAEGPNTYWERFFVKHKLGVLDILPLLAIAVTLVSPTGLRRILGNDLAGRRSWKSPLLWLIVGVLTLFVGWSFFGTQQGLFSFQPVEAGKFAVVVFLGAVLAQWLIRTRMIAFAWFTLTIPAVALSIAFVLVLLLIPVLQSDYSPLIVIAGTVAAAGIVGAALIGLRIREEEKEDAIAFGLLPVAFLPTIRDRAGSWWWMALAFAVGGCAAVFAWIWGESAASIAIVVLLVWLAVLGLFLRRIHRMLAMLAVTGPMLALAGAYYLQNLPVRAALGVENWSWSETPDRQIEMLQAVWGDGKRTLPIDRLMSWADLRYGNADKDGKPRAITVRDKDYHVMRSRAALARAPCNASPEFSAAPFGIGAAVAALSARLSHLLGGTCEPYASELEKPSCSSANLKAAIRPHCVPVVQSDFAATYLAVRHGQAAVALLVLCQFLVALMALQVFLELQSKRSRDPVETGADQAMALIALGCGLLFVMQWVFAWSNAFGLLPVMGQPMTWLSAATSHHLFMAIPAALAIMVAIRLAGLRGAALPIREPMRRRN